MVKAFETELKSFLKEFAKVQFYLGEFDEPEEMERVITNENMIFIDFQGYQDDNLHGKEAHWNLYYLARSANQGESYREKTQHDLVEFIEEMDAKLESESFANSQPIEMISLKKLFNGITDNGYLTVYSRSFKVKLYENNDKFFK